jgi:FtsZ-interacting cell division protein ZipA
MQWSARKVGAIPDVDYKKKKKVSRKKKNKNKKSLDVISLANKFTKTKTNTPEHRPYSNLRSNPSHASFHKQKQHSPLSSPSKLTIVLQDLELGTNSVTTLVASPG